MKRLITIILAGILTLCIAFPVLAEDYSMLGLYTSNGYENEYFNYQLQLPPGNWTLVSRAIISLIDADIVEDSNKENTLSFLKTSLNLSSATAFEADYDAGYIAITIESPGIAKDQWADEQTIAETSLSSVIEEIESVEDVSVTQLEAQSDYLDDFIDGRHYCNVYKCLLNDVPYYGVQIYVRSKDALYLSVIDIQSFYPEDIQIIADAFSVLR